MQSGVWTSQRCGGHSRLGTREKRPQGWGPLRLPTRPRDMVSKGRQWGACGQSPVGLWGRRRGQVGGGRPSAKGQQWSEGALTALPKRTVALTKFPQSGGRLSEQVQKAGTLGTPRQRPCDQTAHTSGQVSRGGVLPFSGQGRRDPSPSQQAVEGHPGPSRVLRRSPAPSLPRWWRWAPTPGCGRCATASPPGYSSPPGRAAASSSRSRTRCAAQQARGREGGRAGGRAEVSHVRWARPPAAHRVKGRRQEGSEPQCGT